MNSPSNLERLVTYNCAVLDQGLQIVAAYARRPEADYAAHVGPHLRHVIEHYASFIVQLPGRAIDYDSRTRDRDIEREHGLARTHIQRLQTDLQGLPGQTFADPVTVHMRGGLAGEEAFIGFSTVSRELMFLASHAVHHYALVRTHALEQGIDLGADFGKAPATVRHEQQR